MAKYEWLASNSAPRGCPMKLVQGDFIFPNDGSVYIPTKRLHNGWGEEVSLHVVGPDTKSLPDRMNITFYSYLEDKFYRGEFMLPHARIAELFAEGYTDYSGPDSPQHKTFELVVAGVAPGGAVAVWVTGTSKRVEVFFGNAKEANLDWHASMRMHPSVNREESRLQSIAEVSQDDPLVSEMQKALPLGVWQAYRSRYHWQPVLENLARPRKVAFVSYLNGEREFIELPSTDAPTVTRRPAPEYFGLTADANGQRLAYSITFDDRELLSVFPRLGRGDTPLDLIFSYRPERNELVVLVRNERETVTLEHVKIEVHAGS